MRVSSDKVDNEADKVHVVQGSSQSFDDIYSEALYRQRFAVVSGSWVVFIVAAIFGFAAFYALPQLGFVPPLAESTIVANKLQQHLAPADYGLSIVCQGMNGLKASDAIFQQYCSLAKAGIATLSDVVAIISAADFPSDARLVSDDGSKSVIFATIKKGLNEYTTKELKTAARQYLGGASNFQILVGGEIPLGQDMNEQVLLGLLTAEASTIPIVFFLLCYTMGTFSASLLSWYVSIGTICLSLGFVMAFARSFNVSSLVTNVVTMLGIGISFDFSLLIVRRFMEYRLKWKHVHVSKIIKRTFQTAGKTVLFSGSLLAVASLGGLFFHEYYLASMLMTFIIVAFCAAGGSNVWLLAQLAILDHNVFRYPWPQWATPPPITVMLERLAGVGKRHEIGGELVKSEHSAAAATLEKHAAAAADFLTVACEGDAEAGSGEAAGAGKEEKGENAALDEFMDTGSWQAVADFVAARPRLCFFSSFSFLVAWSAYFFMTVKFGIGGDPTLLSPAFETRRADMTLTRDFSLMGNSRIFVYLQTTPGVSVTGPAFLSALDSFVSKVKTLPGVNNAFSMVSTGTGMSLAQYQDLYASYATQPSKAVMVSKLAYPMMLTDLNQNTYVDIAISGEKCGDVGKTLVRSLRAMTPAAFPNSMLSYEGVGGYPAVCLDTKEDVASVAPTWLGILFGSTFLVLFVMSRSILIPLKAVCFAALTLSASMGILVRLFPNQTDANVEETLNFLGNGYIDIETVVFIVSVGFGLGVDYETFVVSRIVEEYRAVKDFGRAISVSLTQTGKIITSAAIMIGVVVFAFIGSNVLLIKEIGVGIAISILLDSFLVRTFLVPSFLLLAGEKATWWCPSFLLQLLDLLGLGEGADSALEDLDALEADMLAAAASDGVAKAEEGH